MPMHRTFKFIAQVIGDFLTAKLFGNRLLFSIEERLDRAGGLFQLSLDR